MGLVESKLLAMGDLLFDKSKLFFFLGIYRAGSVTGILTPWLLGCLVQRLGTSHTI